MKLAPKGQADLPDYVVQAGTQVSEACGNIFRFICSFFYNARVVKLADTQVSEACGRKAVLVQVQSRARDRSNLKRLGRFYFKPGHQHSTFGFLPDPES